mgnify:CR=1 FL=1
MNTTNTTTTTMHYRGYTAQVQYSEPDQCVIGQILGIDDIVSFECQSASDITGDITSDITAAFHEAVDDYLETCQRLSRTPNLTNLTNPKNLTNPTAPATPSSR